MKWGRRNKRGSISVFLIMILASFIMLIGVLVHNSARITSKSYADAVFDLAGRSILSEYNIKLMEDYGLFAMRGQEEEIENKLNFYAVNSFKKDKGFLGIGNKRNMDLLRLDLKWIDVDLKGYSICNVDILENQMLDHVKYKMAKELLINPEKRIANPNQGIELLNEKEINNLPSQGYKGSNINISQIIESGIPSISELKDWGMDTFLVNEYIMNTFQNKRGVYEERRSLFTNEVEYILCGELNDDDNYKDTRRYLILLRTGLNLAHIYSDPAKREEVIAMAALLTPGPGAVATQLILATTWAGVEAENDLRLLEEGKKVALIKFKKNWALDLEGVVEGISGNGPVEPVDKSGIEYEDYLRILLFFQNREMKLLRTMDLIQLNIRANYHKDFLMKDHYGGFEFEAMVQDRRYYFVEKY